MAVEGQQPGDEHLTTQEIRALDLIRDSVGVDAAKNARLLLLREHVKRISEVSTQDIDFALDYLEGEGTLRKGTGPLHRLTKKYVLEDRSRLGGFKTYLRGLRAEVETVAQKRPAPAHKKPTKKRKK